MKDFRPHGLPARLVGHAFAARRMALYVGVAALLMELLLGAHPPAGM